MEACACVPVQHFSLLAVRFERRTGSLAQERRSPPRMSRARQQRTRGSCAGSPVSDSHPRGSRLVEIIFALPAFHLQLPANMHAMITLLAVLFQIQTSRHSLFAHAITSPTFSALSDEKNSFQLHYPNLEQAAVQQNQERQQQVSLDSSATAQHVAENNSNSFANVLRVEDVTSKSIKVRLETRTGSNSLVLQKIFFKNIQRNSDWKQYVVDEKRYREENDSFTLTNLLCGNKYQVYGMIIDREGQSSVSEVLLTKTTGREPLAPPVTHSHLSLSSFPLTSD